MEEAIPAESIGFQLSSPVKSQNKAHYVNFLTGLAPHLVGDCIVTTTDNSIIVLKTGKVGSNVIVYNLEISETRYQSIELFTDLKFKNCLTFTANSKTYIFGYRISTQDLVAAKIDLNTLQIEEFTPSNPPPFYLKGASSCLIGDKVYLFGGIIDHASSNSTFVFDLQNESFTRLITFSTPIPRYGHSSFNLKGQFAIFGGECNGEIYDDMYVLDSTMTWHKVNDVKPTNYHPRLGFGFHCRKSLLLISGGRAGSTVFSDLWCFDTRTLKWREVDLSSIGDASLIPVYNNHFLALTKPEQRIILAGKTEQNAKQQVLLELDLIEIEKKETVPPPQLGENNQATELFYLLEFIRERFVDTSMSVADDSLRDKISEALRRIDETEESLSKIDQTITSNIDLINSNFEKDVSRLILKFKNELDKKLEELVYSTRKATKISLSPIFAQVESFVVTLKSINQNLSHNYSKASREILSEQVNTLDALIDEANKLVDPRSRKSRNVSIDDEESDSLVSLNLLVSQLSLNSEILTNQVKLATDRELSHDEEFDLLKKQVHHLGKASDNQFRLSRAIFDDVGKTVIESKAVKKILKDLLNRISLLEQRPETVIEAYNEPVENTPPVQYINNNYEIETGSEIEILRRENRLYRTKLDNLEQRTAAQFALLTQEQRQLQRTNDILLQQINESNAMIIDLISGSEKLMKDRTAALTAFTQITEHNGEVLFKKK